MKQILAILLLILLVNGACTPQKTGTVDTIEKVDLPKPEGSTTPTPLSETNTPPLLLEE